MKVRYMCLVLTVAVLCTAHSVRAIPLVTNEGAYEPDIYRQFVVYRDLMWGGNGSGIMLYDLAAGTKTRLASGNVDDNPAVGEHRVIWCDRRWGGGFGIVSTIIGSGVEDAIVQNGGSTCALDVNDRWAIWADSNSVLRSYNFASGTVGVVTIPGPYATVYTASAVLDHYSDEVLCWQGSNVWSVNLATGVATESTEAAYNASRHASYNGISVWWEDYGYGQRDVFISAMPDVPEPSSLIAIISGMGWLGGVASVVRMRQHVRE